MLPRLSQVAVVKRIQCGEIANGILNPVWVRNLKEFNQVYVGGIKKSFSEGKGLKTKLSSLKMNNITVIELKAIEKQHGIEGYYKLRKAELIHKLEALLEVNEQVLIPGLELPRNTTRSVNTSAILDQPILDDNTPLLKPTQKFIAKSKQKIKDCWNWLLDYIPPKPKIVDEALKFLKNQIKKLYNSQNLR